ncbi:MAG: SDR family oxidoreductase [Acidimicrobiales bacterium]|nr:SDR family oxidoreductase [Acidimicrobiales bacterium]
MAANGARPLVAPWPTALVTGASSGIGAAIARELVDRGVRRVVLVARRREQLEALAEELRRRSRGGAVVEVIVADLSDPESRAAVEARLAEPSAEPPVDLLVNNAGVGTSGAFWELPVDGEQTEIDLNVTAVVRLTRAVLPGMIARIGGSILNISSLAGNQPAPRMATYAATKAFVTSFTESLHEELRGTAVTATAVLPGYVHTEFQSHLGTVSGYESAPRFAWMQPERVAVEALDAAAAGRPLCVPGLGYRIVAALESPLPRSARRWLISRLGGLPAALARV